MAFHGKDDVLDIKAQAHVWKIIYGFADSLVLRCAVELGIVDIIDNNNQPMALADLASKLPVSDVNCDNLYRILRYLVKMEILRVEKSDDGQKKYALEPIATLLSRNAKRSMVPMILGMTQKDFMTPWHSMKDGLSDNGTAFEKAMGMTIWEYLEGHPDQSQLFNEGMAGETRLLTSSLISGSRDMFQGIDSLVDVGGGNGTTVKAISDAFPHIKCTLFDLPHVIANSYDLPNIERIGGDMFKSVPSAQAIILKLILHDWNDEDSIKILKQCRNAVPKDGGKVIIVDVALDEESDHELSSTRLILDIDMLVNTGGKERTKEVWEKIVKSAGFSGCKIRHIAAIQSVIEVFP
uniref:3'-hydroxy-N-methyl-(S)-coclaurine 4'-O-methyltransferase n=1 Tax=Coptis japonica TaxID=3442 RepID=4OMT_COPJA|nr:RecName: Full=3'-hydroxy-N-methyl-(S)-coclaurine 4'-O-methyltransferase; AltName: Full=S-adenosyl-L-methionine:3'-hydroxy-N-methylcoclaurine 4'-O-methyltransferase; Short=4'-OMT [Coptis japonica]BAB08005.1 S-adenosyl-L-methionine:3'-hydroxy-N-methylcocla urine 4'-O-methyltransferase [Coptis japonica]